MRPGIDESVTVREYDPRWPLAYAAERVRIVEALHGIDVTIEHIGSTSVPGLTAKPVVDILVGLRLAGHDVIGAALERLGYEALGEAGVPGRLYFRMRDSPQPFNVHVVERGGALWRNNLVFRDFLRTHSEEATAYAQAKQVAAEAAPASLIEYSELKAQTVDSLLAKARIWAERGGWPATTNWSETISSPSWSSQHST